MRLHRSRATFFPQNPSFRSFWSHFCGRKGAPQMFLIIVKKAFYLILCGVGGFFQRYFGKEVVDYLIDPFVEGTSTGDPEYLSMRYSFPDLWNLEERFGSFIAGAIQSKLSSRKEKSGEKKGSLKKTKHQCGSFSFKGGMQTLADTLSKEIGVDEIKLNSKVLSLSYCPDGKSARENWSVSFAAKHVNHSQALSVDAVIVTILNSFKEIETRKKESTS